MSTDTITHPLDDDNGRFSARFFKWLFGVEYIEFSAIHASLNMVIAEHQKYLDEARRVYGSTNDLGESADELLEDGAALVAMMNKLNPGVNDLIYRFHGYINAPEVLWEVYYSFVATFLYQTKKSIPTINKSHLIANFLETMASEGFNGLWDDLL